MKGGFGIERKLTEKPVFKEWLNTGACGQDAWHVSQLVKQENIAKKGVYAGGDIAH